MCTILLDRLCVVPSFGHAICATGADSASWHDSIWSSGTPCPNRGRGFWRVGGWCTPGLLLNAWKSQYGEEPPIRIVAGTSTGAVLSQPPHFLGVTRSTTTLLSIASQDQLRSILKFMLDEREFLSPYGVRALSQFHRGNPYLLHVDGMEHRVDYDPGESSTGLFGGNSNWRGPIWFPLNYLLVESLQKFHHYLGDEFQVEFPTGSGKMMTLWEVAGELSRRMTNIFLRDENGRRPVFGNLEKFQTDPHWRDLVLFHEYFHGDSGAGVGASHQTGWTGVVTKLMQQSGESSKRNQRESAAATVAAD